MVSTWTAFRHDLPEDPRVLGMARILGVTMQHVIGCLKLVWRLADVHAVPRSCPGGIGTIEGFLNHYTVADISAAAHQPGFGDALRMVEWLSVYTDGVAIPDWDVWFSRSAKQRHSESRKKRRQRDVARRESDRCPGRAGTKTGTTEQNRTEQYLSSPSDEGEGPLSPEKFLLDWNATPNVKLAKSLAGTRLKHFRARASNPAWRADYPKALAHVPQSRFLRGENERGWLPTVDWFLRPDSVSKVLEGFYDDGPTPKPSGAKLEAHSGIREWLGAGGPAQGGAKSNGPARICPDPGLPGNSYGGAADARGAGGGVL